MKNRILQNWACKCHRVKSGLQREVAFNSEGFLLHRNVTNSYSFTGVAYKRTKVGWPLLVRGSFYTEM